MSNKLKLTISLCVCLVVAIAGIVFVSKSLNSAKSENEQLDNALQDSIIATPEVDDEPDPESNDVYPVEEENDVAANDGMSQEVIDENIASGLEAMESIAAIYDTSTESKYNYVGIPQVDNCIGTLLGSGKFELVDDAEDTIDSVPVHLYVIGINDIAYTVVYYPGVEAVAINMGISVDEYRSGENGDED